MSKYLVEKYVKIPVLVVVEANDEFEALHNIAHGDWSMVENLDDDYEWVVDGVEGIESNLTNYTIIKDEKGKEVRRMTNEVANSYID